MDRTTKYSRAKLTQLQRRERERFVGGGGRNLCVGDRERRPGPGSTRKGVQCMCERVCMQVDEKW